MLPFGATQETVTPTTTSRDDVTARPLEAVVENQLHQQGLVAVGLVRGRGQRWQRGYQLGPMHVDQ